MLNDRLEGFDGLLESVDVLLVVFGGTKGNVVVGTEEEAGLRR